MTTTELDVEQSIDQFRYYVCRTRQLIEQNKDSRRSHLASSCIFLLPGDKIEDIQDDIVQKELFSCYTKSLSPKPIS